MSTPPWRPRLCFADSVALLAASSLTLAVATPAGVRLGVVAPPSNIEALDRVTATLPTNEVPKVPFAGSWVQFVPTASPPADALTTAVPVADPTTDSARLTPPTPRRSTTLRALRPPTGSVVMSGRFGVSRLSIHRVDPHTHPRYRASLHALQRLTHRPTIALATGPRSARSNPIARVPLKPGRESWQASRDLVLNGHLPHPDLVRSEAFVAATGRPHPHHDNDAPVAVHADIASARPDGHTLLLQVTATTAPLLAPTRLPLELVLVLDTSGSMGVSGALDEVRSAVLSFASQLGRNDRVSIIAFHGAPAILLPPTQAVDRTELIETLADLRPEGSTDAASGVRLAIETLSVERTSSHRRHIVMFSDGDLMATGRDAWGAAAAEVVRQNARLTTVAIGQEWAESGPLEAQMARLGATHHAVRDGHEAAEKVVAVLRGDAPASATQLALAVRFDPQIVDTYELLGWEGSGPGRLTTNVPRVELPAGSHSSALLRVKLHTSLDAHVGKSLGQVLVSEKGETAHVEAPLVLPASGVPALHQRPALAMADAAAQLARALRVADPDALDAAAALLHARSRSGRPEDAVLLRVARRSANLARLPVLAPGTNAHLDPRLSDLMHTLGEDCFRDLSTRRGDRHGQITARARFHHGRFAGAVILDDKIGDRMLEACILQRLRTWEPPTGMEGDLVLPLVWGPGHTEEGEGTDRDEG